MLVVQAWEDKEVDAKFDMPRSQEYMGVGGSRKLINLWLTRLLDPIKECCRKNEEGRSHRWRNREV